MAMKSSTEASVPLGVWALVAHTSAAALKARAGCISRKSHARPDWYRKKAPSPAAGAHEQGFGVQGRLHQPKVPCPAGLVQEESAITCSRGA